MSNSRHEFYLEMREMGRLCDESLLLDTFPPSAIHNISARILRRGIAIAAFSHLESYLETRLEELITALGQCPIPFASFDDELRQFLTVQAALGLANRLGFISKPHREAYATAEIVKLAGFAAQKRTYTAKGFSPRGSNVAADDIGSALKALGVSGKPWDRLKQTASTLGAAPISMSDDFANAAMRRHQSAHNAATNVPTVDLKEHVATVTLIGICFDILVSSHINVLTKAPNIQFYIRAKATMSPAIRFVDQSLDGYWLERASPQGRAVKRYADEASARSGAVARTRVDFVVVRDLQQRPIALA